MKKPANLLKPLSKTKLYEEIVEQLKNRIINKDLLPGEKLPPERSLAEMLNVNRSTVRSALSKLESMDLVEIRHGEGVYVKDYLDSGSLELVKDLLFKNRVLNMDVFKNLMDLRQLLVPEMAYCAAQNRNNEDLAAIKQVVMEPGEDNLDQRDIRLHHLIAKASGNVLYVLLLNAFTSQMNQYYELYFSSPENRAETLAFHQNIYQALKKQKPDMARKIMVDVMQRAADNMMSMLSG